MPVNTFTCTMKDHLGNRKPVSYSQKNLIGTFTDHSDDLQVILEKYSNALCVGRTDTESHKMLDVIVPDPEGEGFDLVGNVAVLMFTRKGGPLNLLDAEPMKLTIPAAKESMFEKVGGKQTMRVKQATGEAIASELSSAMGEEVTFSWGKQEASTRGNKR